MKPCHIGYRFVAVVGVLVGCALLLGCPPAEPPPVEPPPPAVDLEEEPKMATPEPDPFDPPLEPAEPPAEPFDPPVEPEEPPVEPEEPPMELEEPPVEPFDPPMEAEEPDPDDAALDFPKPPNIDDTWEPPKPEPWDLGPPLVDNPDHLKALDPEQPVWLDAQNRRIVFVGKVCQREVPLEMFACLRYTKEHEAIVVADVKALTVHAGLLAVGAEPGNPVQFHPEYVPASGTEIEVTVRWKDAEGKVQTARAQDWIKNTETGEAMTQPWVFAGSGFWVDPSGKKTYQAEGGDFICVANFATAMLDLPIESSQANHMLAYTAYTERIPPLETPVTVRLTPKLQPRAAEAADVEATEEAGDAEESREAGSADEAGNAKEAEEAEEAGNAVDADNAEENGL